MSDDAMVRLDGQEWRCLAAAAQASGWPRRPVRYTAKAVQLPDRTSSSPPQQHRRRSTTGLHHLGGRAALTPSTAPHAAWPN
ncbi:hypothetical protein [Streptomyces sp. NPDC003832]